MKPPLYYFLEAREAFRIDHLLYGEEVHRKWKIRVFRMVTQPNGNRKPRASFSQKAFIQGYEDFDVLITRKNGGAWEAEQIHEDEIGAFLDLLEKDFHPLKLPLFRL